MAIQINNFENVQNKTAYCLVDIVSGYQDIHHVQASTMVDKH